MNAPQKWFDADAELQKIRDTPAKVAKPANQGGSFSDFSRGRGENLRERQPSRFPLQSASETKGKDRPFVPRPLGQETNPDVWGAWRPLFDWLIEYHPEHYHGVCDAEEALRTLEQQGITVGPEYEEACQELGRRFETARRLKLVQGFKVWVQ